MICRQSTAFPLTQIQLTSHTENKKFSMTHPGGRPRTVSPSPDECIELGKDLVEWANNNKDFNVLFGQWWALKQFMTRRVWKSLIQMPEFLPYYESAQQALAIKCIDGTLKEGFGQRYLRLYDRDVVEDENDKAKHLSDLRKAENTALGSYLVETISYATHKNNTPT